MAPNRSIATRTAARTSSVENSGIFSTALVNGGFGPNADATGHAARLRAVHHRSADGYGR